MPRAPAVTSQKIERVRDKPKGFECYLVWLNYILEKSIAVFLRYKVVRRQIADLKKKKNLIKTTSFYRLNKFREITHTTYMRS